MYGDGLMIAPVDGPTMVQVTTSQLMMLIVKARVRFGEWWMILHNYFLVKLRKLHRKTWVFTYAILVVICFSVHNAIYWPLEDSSRQVTYIFFAGFLVFYFFLCLLLINCGRITSFGSESDYVCSLEASQVWNMKKQAEFIKIIPWKFLII